MSRPQISSVLLACALGLATLPLTSCQMLLDIQERMNRPRTPVVAGNPQQQQQPQQLPDTEGTENVPIDGGSMLPPGYQPPPVSQIPDRPPVAIPVPGKRGIVRSPHVDNPNALIDVTGYPPGTEMTDPHSGKTFLVP